MKQFLIILLLSIHSLCNAQKKPLPQFIEFEAKYAHPEILLADYRPLYISTVELNLPLPDAYAKIIEHERLKPTMSAIDISRLKDFYVGTMYSNMIIDVKSFDHIHDYILRNSDLLAVKLHRPACLVVIDKKRRYLPQNKMKTFYNGLKVELIKNKADTTVLGRIKYQFTTVIE